MRIMSTLLFPLQIERQYGNPLDVHAVFKADSDMQTYLSNPLRYGGQVSACLEKNALYMLDSTKTTWLKVGDLSEEQKSKLALILSDGDGSMFLSNDGTYKKETNADWLVSNTNNPAYIKNKPSIFTQEEVLAGWDYILSQMAGTYAKQTDILALPIHTHSNKGVLDLLKESVDGSLSYNSKKLLTGVTLINNSYTVDFESKDTVNLALDVEELLSSSKISIFMNSECVIVGDAFVEIYDGEIFLYSFTSTTSASKFDLGISKNIKIKIKGSVKIKYNYTALGGA